MNHTGYDSWLGLTSWYRWQQILLVWCMVHPSSNCVVFPVPPSSEDESIFPNSSYKQFYLLSPLFWYVLCYNEPYSSTNQLSIWHNARSYSPLGLGDLAPSMEHLISSTSKLLIDAVDRVTKWSQKNCFVLWNCAVTKSNFRFAKTKIKKY